MLSKFDRFALGGTLFGWTLDKQQSFKILDYYFFNLEQRIIDTADSYSQWKPGNKGGESESLIGEWISSRKINREEIFVISKIGKKLDRFGYEFRVCKQAIEDSLKRLRTEYIDLLFVHHPPNNDFEILSLAANLNKLNESNFYRNIGLSNFSIRQIELFLGKDLVQNQSIYALQNHYNLIERDSSRLAFDEYSRKTNLGVSSQILPWIVANKKFFFAYHALCRGVLTDRFLAMNGQVANSIHLDKTQKYIKPEVFNLLNLAKGLALKYETTVSAVSLSWLKQEYPQTIPVVSFNSIFQLKQVSKMVQLTDLEFQSLDILMN